MYKATNRSVLFTLHYGTNGYPKNIPLLPMHNAYILIRCNVVNAISYTLFSRTIYVPLQPPTYLGTSNHETR